MKAIITGANGFVGSALLRELLSNDIEVLAIDINFSEDRIPKDTRITKMALSMENIKDLEEVIKFEDFDVFYHFAWVGSSGPLRADEIVQTTNAIWTVDCLKTAKRIGCKKFVCAGSIMEFEVHEAIYAQGSKPSLNYIYGVGKVLAHELCKPIANEIGIDLIWAYITNAYGVGEQSPRFINTTLRKIIKNEKLEFTSATQNYDFVYIDDVAYAFYLLGIKGKANKGYIIGSGNAKPLKDFIVDMCETNSGKNKPQFGDVPFTGVDVPLHIFDTTEIEVDCGFFTSISFGEGTKRTLEWLMKVDRN